MENPKKKGSPSYRRKKGHDGECEYARRFRELGYAFCKTSREASRLHDACKIDLHGIPYNIQIKTGFRKQRPNAEAIFREMGQLIKKNVEPSDPIHKRPKILIHAAHGYYPEGELVTMTWSDFLPFLQAYKILQDGTNSTDRSEGRSSPEDNG